VTNRAPFELKAGAWTDDTSISLCLAASPVECSVRGKEPPEIRGKKRRGGGPAAGFSGWSGHIRANASGRNERVDGAPQI
jgi:hypothetical protein